MHPVIRFWIPGCIGALTLSAIAFAQQAPQQNSTASPVGIARGTPAAASANSRPASSTQPEWFPLAPDHEKYLDEILKFWEYQAGQITRYRCNFIRWEYDPVVLPLNPDVATTVAKGKIEYQAPDKGLFQVEQMWDVERKQQGETVVVVTKDGKESYVTRTSDIDEHYVCDGKSVFEWNSRSQQIIQRDLPRELQGTNIAAGPLPFLFGAKAEMLKQRYWLRVIDPKNKKPKRFYLEAIPKLREDSADFRMIHIIIDEDEFLPEALILFHPGGSRKTFEFKDREKNWTVLPEMLTPWMTRFYAPKPAAGWKLVKEPYQASAAAGAPSAARTQLPVTGSRQAANRATAPR